MIRMMGCIALLGLLACDTETRPSSAPTDSPPDSPATTPSGATATPPSGPDAATPTAEPTATLLTPDGWGPLRIGMSRAEVVAAAGEDANPNAVGGPDPDRCDEFRPESAPQGVLVMIERDVLTRITVARDTSITTPAGVGVGDPADRLDEQLGADVVESDHAYQAAPARYLTVWSGSGDSRRGIRYEIGSDGRIVRLLAGGPSIEYVEGCI